MIEIQGVSKAYHRDKAVDKLSMTIHKGSVFGLLGSNGAGKTTLLKMIAGICLPDEGQVLVEGMPVFEHPETKKRMVFLPDAPYFFPQTSLMQMAQFYKSVYPQWNEARFRQLATVFQLDPKRKLHRLSKGMQRQAAFWLALSCMPEVLILDEPIDGLDPVMRRQIKNLLFQESAERGLTVIISSHNLREIEDLCDHVGIMHKGRLIIEKELDQLKSDTHKVQVAFRNKEQEQMLMGKLQVLYKEIRGSVRIYVVKGERDYIHNTFLACDPLVLDLLPLTLEEIFIYEMGDADYEVQPILL
jgi:ABC-2 type transport system ATP-binding protein